MILGYIMSEIEYVSHYFSKSAGITLSQQFIMDMKDDFHFRNNTEPDNTFQKPTRSYDFQYRLTFNSTCGNNFRWFLFKQYLVQRLSLIHSCFYTPRGFKDHDKYLAEFFLQGVLRLFFIFTFLFSLLSILFFFYIINRVICDFDEYIGILNRYLVRIAFYMSGSHSMDSLFTLTHLKDSHNYGSINFNIWIDVEKVVKIWRVCQSGFFTIDLTRSYGVDANLFTKFI